MIDLKDVSAFMKDRKVSRWSKIFGALAVVYVISPIDISPDAIPVLGWLDDAGVVSSAVTYFLWKIAGYSKQRAAQLPGQPANAPLLPPK